MKYDEKMVNEKITEMLKNVGIAEHKLDAEDYRNLMSKSKELVIAFIDCKRKCEQYDLVEELEKRLCVLS